MTAEQPTFMQRCINWLKTRVDKLRGVDTQAADEVDILARKFVSTFNLNKGNGTQKTRYALSGKKSVITQGMTEQERYEILKDKKIALTAKADNAKLDSILSKLERDGNNVSYESVKVRDKIKLFRKIGEEFGIFKEYSNKDISLSFEYSKGSLEESAYKQKRNFNSFAKMLTCFDAVIENAVGIEVHNRNEQGYKTDMTLKEVYVLASAFEDGGEIVPVKLEVKEFTDKQNTLYIAIALESIKKDEVVAQGNTNNGVTQYPRSSNISISDLLRNVNPLDESFYKYIPKMFFEGENTPKKRYALSSTHADGVDLIDNYTEKQYNDFGWARVNGVLSYRENGNFRTKYGEIKSGKQSGVHKTSKGEIIVAVNDMEKGKFGINNVLVFAKGSYENYKITRVIRLKSNSETHLDIVRGFIYEYENDTNAQTRYTLEELYGEELIKQYDSRDFDDYRTSKARARARGRGTQSVGSKQDSGIGAIGKGNTDSDSDNGVKRQYALSAVDSDGKALSKEQQDYFKDSKMRDEDGNLLVVYHRTPNEFTIFDIKKSNINNWYREGFYFSDNQEVAKTYGRKLMRLYLDIKNPYIPTADKILDSGEVEFAPSFIEDFKNRFSEAQNDKSLLPHTVTEI